MIKVALNLVAWKTLTVQDRAIKTETTSCGCEGECFMISMNVRLKFIRTATVVSVKMIQDRRQMF